MYIKHNIDTKVKVCNNKIISENMKKTTWHLYVRIKTHHHCA